MRRLSCVRAAVLRRVSWYGWACRDASLTLALPPLQAVTPGCLDEVPQQADGRGAGGLRPQDLLLLPLWGTEEEPQQLIRPVFSKEPGRF